jgi:Ser/Thr protein kinase RdoA (MazF antagonist)
MVRPGPAHWTGLWKLGREIVAESIDQVVQIHEELNQVANRIVPIQPCIRDIWEQHILYEGDKVSGIVDFCAARPDTVSTDIVRLLGSLVADDPQGWKTGMDAYSQMRPLTENELLLIDSLDRSTVLLSGLNWLAWIYLENRIFIQKQVIEQRLGVILNRLKNQAANHS